jgi:hypothetical protein
MAARRSFVFGERFFRFEKRAQSVAVFFIFLLPRYGAAWYFLRPMIGASFRS